MGVNRVQLRGETISFNGINSSKYGLYLCSVGNSDNDRSFGVTRSIEEENGAVKAVKEETKTIEIQLIKMSSGFKKPIPLTDEELEEISHWLFSPEEYKPLMVDNRSVVYYGMFVDGSIWQNGANQGYLTLQFQMDSGHGYSVVQNTDIRVNGTRNITLNSKHTIGRYSEIDIEIELANNQDSLVIENFKHIRVYNEGLKHVANVSNPSQNLRPYFNKEFIHLAYGTNNIKITGVGKVRFISQAKLTFI